MILFYKKGCSNSHTIISVISNRIFQLNFLRRNNLSWNRKKADIFGESSVLNIVCPKSNMMDFIFSIHKKIGCKQIAADFYCIDQFAFVRISSSACSKNASTPTTPRSPSRRERTATAFFSISFSPITSIYGIF